VLTGAQPARALVADTVPRYGLAMTLLTLFSTKPYDRDAFAPRAAAHGIELRLLEHRLDADTARLAAGGDAVCAFVNDVLSAGTLEALADVGVRLVALRCAGFNHVDLAAAARLGITIARVPAYSPHAVAELAVGLILSLNRKLHRAHARVREGNFSLHGLTGFDLVGKSVAVIGAGRIGLAFARIMRGFGCEVLVVDPLPVPELEALGARQVSLDEALAHADIVSLHCPLTPATHHVINATTIDAVRPGVMIINTGRGALLDTRAVIDGLKRGRIGYLGLDVYEEEEELFFEDHSFSIIQDDVFMRLLTFPNVMITAHQGFLTDEALANIAETTLSNVAAFRRGDAAGVHAVPTAQTS
jgi:D-lactate dehydrogenase